MKKTTMIITFLFLATWAFAQVEDSVKIAMNKVTVFSIFDTRFEVKKNDDGTKTWEIIPHSKVYDEKAFETKMNRKSKHSTGLDVEIGINTWIGDSDAPAVRPWGSWNPALNSYYTYKPSKNFHLKTMLGVSWYNFKFEDSNLQALRTPNGIIFEQFEDGGGIKSKISASYANISLIPSVRSNNGKFRFGVGPYAGLRLGGRGKLVYRDDSGNRRREFQMANMFANDFRYGGRMEIGIGGVDLFMNYDFNEMFQTDKGPTVNTLSFGIIL